METNFSFRRREQAAARREEMRLQAKAEAQRTTTSNNAEISRDDKETTEISEIKRNHFQTQMKPTIEYSVPVLSTPTKENNRFRFYHAQLPTSDRIHLFGPASVEKAKDIEAVHLNVENKVFNNPVEKRNAHVYDNSSSPEKSPEMLCDANNYIQTASKNSRSVASWSTSDKCPLKGENLLESECCDEKRDGEETEDDGNWEEAFQITSRAVVLEPVIIQEKNLREENSQKVSYERNKQHELNVSVPFRGNWGGYISSQANQSPTSHSSNGWVINVPDSDMDDGDTVLTSVTFGDSETSHFFTRSKSDSSPVNRTNGMPVSPPRRHHHSFQFNSKTDKQSELEPMSVKGMAKMFDKPKITNAGTSPLIASRAAMFDSPPTARSPRRNVSSPRNGKLPLSPRQSSKWSPSHSSELSPTIKSGLQVQQSFESCIQADAPRKNETTSDTKIEQRDAPATSRGWQGQVRNNAMGAKQSFIARNGSISFLPSQQGGARQSPSLNTVVEVNKSSDSETNSIKSKEDKVKGEMKRQLDVRSAEIEQLKNQVMNLQSELQEDKTARDQEAYAMAKRNAKVKAKAEYTALASALKENDALRRRVKELESEIEELKMNAFESETKMSVGSSGKRGHHVHRAGRSMTKE